MRNSLQLSIVDRYWTPFDQSWDFDHNLEELLGVTEENPIAPTGSIFVEENTTPVADAATVGGNIATGIVALLLGHRNPPLALPRAPLNASALNGKIG